MEPISVALIITAVSLAIFFGIAFNERLKIKSTEDYFLSAKSVRKDLFSNSTVAASTSLATVLIWFVEQSRNDGVFLLVAPVTLLVGFYILWKLVPELSRTAFFEKHDSLYSYVEAIFPSHRALRVTIISVSLISMVMLLMLEIYVGSNIFSSIIVHDNPDVSHNIGLMFVSFVIVAYSAVSGLPGILRNDKTQMRAMFLLPILAILAFLFPDVTGTSAPDLSIIFPHTAIDGDKDIFLIYIPLLFYLVVVNALFGVGQLKTWQLNAATSNETELRKGIIIGGLKAFILWSGIILFGLFMWQNVSVVDDEANFYTLLNSAMNSESWFLSYVVVGSVFLAAVAALVSTADSLLLSIAQGLFKLAPNNLQNLATARTSTVLVMAFVILFYFIIVELLKIDFYGILYSSFGVLSVIACPIVARLAIMHEDYAKVPGKLVTIVTLTCVVAILYTAITNASQVLLVSTVAILLNAVVCSVIAIRAK